MNNLRTLVVLAVALLSLIGCGGGADSTVQIEEPPLSLNDSSQNASEILQRELDGDNFFQLSIDKKTYNSEKFAEGHCALNYIQNGESEQFIELRVKDLTEDHILLINIYMPKDEQSKLYTGRYPVISADSPQPSQGGVKRARLIFMENGQLTPENQVFLEKGDVYLEHLEKEEITLRFEGEGKRPQSLSQDLVPIQGKLKLNTVELANAIANN